MKNQCAPHINPKNSGVCLKTQTLLEIINEYNRKNPNKHISKSGTKEDLWRRIKRAMNQSCEDNQVCIVKKLHPESSKIIPKYFKPKIPKGKYQWLSTIDINNVMEQYEKKYPNFAFVGAIPRDFFNIITKFGNENLKKLSKKAEKIGIIFNTDPHYKSGRHWLAILIDIKGKSIEHFDSTGRPPIPEIDEFLKQICNNAYMNLGIRLEKKINNIQHQHKNSECGVYSCYFIIQRLNGRTFEDIIENVVSDDKMNKYRLEYFTKHD